MMNDRMQPYQEVYGIQETAEEQAELLRQAASVQMDEDGATEIIAEPSIPSSVVEKVAKIMGVKVGQSHSGLASNSDFDGLIDSVPQVNIGAEWRSKFLDNTDHRIACIKVRKKRIKQANRKANKLAKKARKK